MTNEADVRKEASGKRRWPVGDKQIATAEHHSQQHVEKGEPVPQLTIWETFLGRADEESPYTVVRYP